MESLKNVFLYQPGEKPMSVRFSDQHVITFPYQSLPYLMPSPMVVASISSEIADLLNISIIVYIPENAVLKPIIPGESHPNTKPADIQENGTSFYSDMEDKFSLSHLYGLNPTGYDQLQFFVAANYSNEEPCNSYVGYQFDFQVDYKSLPDHKSIDEIVTVQAFLWNEDPKTSRGTVTTVIHAT
jgi:hypothetical protein